MNDCSIIKRIKKKDLSALDEVFTQYHKEFINYITRKFPKCTYENADDIFCDANISLYENIISEKINCENLTSTLKTYLFQIGINKTMAMLKKENRYSQIHQQAVSDGSYNPFDEGQTEEKEQKLLQVERCLYELGDPCKSLLELFYYRKMKMEEIANKMGYKTPDVAKNQKAKCMKRLRKYYLEQSEHPNH